MQNQFVRSLVANALLENRLGDNKAYRDVMSALHAALDEVGAPARGEARLAYLVECGVDVEALAQADSNR